MTDDDNEYLSEILSRFCPRCRVRSMVVAAMIPCVRLTALTEIRYRCTRCGATDVGIVQLPEK